MHRLLQGLCHLILLLGLAAMPVQAQTAADPRDTVVLVGDDWCPYNCRLDDARPGFLVDLAERTLRAGHRIDYQVTSWARAQRLVREHQADVLLGVTTTEAEGLTLSLPVAVDVTCFFVRADQAWEYTGPASLEHLRLGVIQDYDYDGGGPLDQLIQRRLRIHDKTLDIAHGPNATLSNFRKLLLGRMDVALESRFVGLYALGKLNMQQQIKTAGCNASYIGTIHYGTDPGNAKGMQILEALNQAISSMLKSGELQALARSYGVDIGIHPPR